MATGIMQGKFGEIRTCDSSDMSTNRQTDRHGMPYCELPLRSTGFTDYDLDLISCAGWFCCFLQSFSLYFCYYSVR